MYSIARSENQDHPKKKRRLLSNTEYSQQTTRAEIEQPNDRPVTPIGGCPSEMCYRTIAIYTCGHERSFGITPCLQARETGDSCLPLKTDIVERDVRCQDCRRQIHHGHRRGNAVVPMTIVMRGTTGGTGLGTGIGRRRQCYQTRVRSGGRCCGEDKEPPIGMPWWKVLRGVLGTMFQKGICAYFSILGRYDRRNKLL